MGYEENLIETSGGHWEAKKAIEHFGELIY